MNDQLKLTNGQVVNAVFVGQDGEGESQYGKWFKYALQVDGNEVVFFANDKNKATFDGLKLNDAFSFGKVEHKSAKGVYHKIERISNGSDTSTTPQVTNTPQIATNNSESRTFSTREASIVAGVAVKVAGWSISPSSFSEEELYNRSKAVLSVISKLEVDLLHKNVEDVLIGNDDQ
jgi:hypothetical protein